MKMSWFSLVLLLLSLTINNLSEAGHGHKLRSAVVSGTVYCDICFQQDFSKAHHFISGASVAVECKDGESRPSFRQVAKTNEQGEFKVRLPFSVTKHVKKIKGCSVKLVRSSKEYNTPHTLDFEQPNYPIFPPPLEDPATPRPSPLLPNLPPLPQLPPLPPLPGLPFPPIPGRN
ncbi:hypothetical protein GOBAR_AA10514 [Gossypium barbadense]|uniref:Pollen Ole e 1 allergen and extensin family protein n=1 Tax=Gossypium barbadense TaxID=3634 RepID=A0A2P5Y3L9_GOSBA|nr:hypothetical protein GOBAR_AA10514 [Gossypium barbadense]